MNVLHKIDHRLRNLIAVVVLVAIAGNVLVSFNGTVNRWPTILLPALVTSGAAINTESFASEPAVINFWASWCVACREEHALLQRMKDDGNVSVYGVNHLDQRDDALRWLGYFGDPYEDNVYDAEGRIGSTLDIDALPVSLVIDAQGVIHYRHRGPLDAATVEKIILPLVDELRRK